MDFKVLRRGKEVLEGGVRGECAGDVFLESLVAEVGGYLGEEVGF